MSERRLFRIWYRVRVGFEINHDPREVAFRGIEEIAASNHLGQVLAGLGHMVNGLADLMHVVAAIAHAGSIA